MRRMRREEMNRRTTEHSLLAHRGAICAHAELLTFVHITTASQA